MSAQFKHSELVLDILASNVAVHDWLDTVANTRIHKDTQEQPYKLWAEIKKFTLQAPPPLYSGVSQLGQEAVLSHCCPHSTLLPGYDATFLQNNIAIYQHIQKIAS